MSDLITTPSSVAHETEISTTEDELELENMVSSLSPFHSVSSDLLEDVDISTLLDPTLPTIPTPTPTKPNNIETLPPSNSPPPTSPPPACPTNTNPSINTQLTVTIDNDTVRFPSLANILLLKTLPI